MKSFQTIKSNIAVINIDNIDTDQIIGSDHLKITNKNGLGKHLFSDWRYLPDGSNNPEFVINQEKTKDSQVIVAGDNFGCGSSREHAPWALLDHGIRVIISSSIADIFSNNSIKNGLLPIKVNQENHQFLLNQNSEDIEVDLNTQTVMCNHQSFTFDIEPFAKYCLTNGIDQLDFLFQHVKEIESYEAR